MEERKIRTINVGYNIYKNIICSSKYQFTTRDYNGEKYIHFLSLSGDEIDYDPENLFEVIEGFKDEFGYHCLVIARAKRKEEPYVG